MKYTIEELKDAVHRSLSIADVCRILNIRPIGGNYKTLKTLFKEYNIDTCHFTGQRWNKGIKFGKSSKLKLEEILVENSTYSNNVNLKHKLLQAGLKKYECECCGNNEWLGKPISLEVHHINGVNTDNRLENLQLLCPNCHAQTDHYRGKNLKSFKNDLANQKYKDFIEGKFDVYNIDSSINNKNKNDKSKHNKPKRFCKCCGKELNRKQLYFCSIKCASEFYSKIPDIDSLINAFKKYKNFSQVAKHFDVSDNAVRKWTNKYNITNDMKKYRYS